MGSIAQRSDALRPESSAAAPELGEVPAQRASIPPERKLQTLTSILALAAVYFLLARLGLSVATVGRSVTLVWPSTGISLVALLLFGYRLWPGVALGALLVNAMTPGVPFLSACGMAIGNTLEAVLATYLLRRAGFRSSLERVRDVLMLVVVAAGLTTTVAATFGSVSLWLGGVITQVQLGTAWRVWWLGDLMGDVIMAPLLLISIGRARRRGRPSYGRKEALELLAATLVIGLVGFGAFLFPSSKLIHPYFVFPALIWAALRFRVPGATVANLVVCGASIWATAKGSGPFSGGTFDENLFQVQTFMAVVAMTTLILGASAAERLRAIRLRDQFLSMASHELKTPLTPMKLQLHLLRRALDEPESGSLAEKLHRKLAIFEKQLDRIIRLVDELLDVSRVESAQLSLNLEQFELGAVVRETVEAFSEELALARCSVEVRSEEQVEGLWDRLRIQQVVSNLLTNAMKYGGGGPIAISVNSEAPRDLATITVSDRGIGIPKEQQELIFEAFERGSYAPRVGGLGLGLYIASKIVEAHRGSIRLSSKLGVGSTFTVQLPRHPQLAIPA